MIQQSLKAENKEIEQGIQLTTARTALQLRKEGFDDVMISKITGLKKEEIILIFEKESLD